MPKQTGTKDTEAGSFGTTSRPSVDPDCSYGSFPSKQRGVRDERGNGSSADATSSRPDVHLTGRRIVATIIDGLVFAALYVAMAATFGRIDQLGEASWTASMPLSATITYGLIVVSYYPLLEWYRGQTLGKMLTGVRVVDEATGEGASLRAALLRTVLRVVDGIAGYLVGFIIVLVTSKRQRLGDLAAHTLVVRSR